MTTHAELRAALDTATSDTSCYIDLNCCYDCRERYRHIDTLRAIAEDHKPRTTRTHTGCVGCGRLWPCATIDVVTDALTKMEAV